MGGALIGVLAWAVVVWLAGGFLLSTGSAAGNAVGQLVAGGSNAQLDGPDSGHRRPGHARHGARQRGLSDGVRRRSRVHRGRASTGFHCSERRHGVVRQGVVKVLTSAPNCGNDSEGSGWVVADNRIITNAHVVAGGTEIFVQAGGSGSLLPATLVVYDPQRDLAVLDVCRSRHQRRCALGSEHRRLRLGRRRGLPRERPVQRRVTARVAPGGAKQSASTSTGSTTVTREIYSLRTTVLPGNSGGPLFDTSGKVVGVVFARSTTDDQTGYALTLTEAQPVIDQAGASTPVSSGACQTE